LNLKFYYMLNPQLSIIIPVYNVEQYINQCIESILAQKYQDYEIILIDDGSTDCSGEICDNYAQKDDRIKTIHKPNGGVSSARNIGLQMSKGKYLTFIDPDDFIDLDTYCENMDIVTNNNEIDILQYPFCKYYNSKHLENIVTHNQYIIGSEDIFSNWWSGSPIHYSIWNKIFKKEIFNDIMFLEGHVSEDTRLVVDLYKRATTIYISDKGLYYYRIREFSLTFNYSFDKHLDLFYAHFYIYTELIKYSSLRFQRALAFERMYRRLIQAKQSNATANLAIELKQLNDVFPKWKDIFLSQKSNKLWLSVAKIIGVNIFTKAYIRYLKIKESP
jgi:glycosyltransferase involved in cell wall biosynthesis